MPSLGFIQQVNLVSPDCYVRTSPTGLHCPSPPNSWRSRQGRRKRPNLPFSIPFLTKVAQGSLGQLHRYSHAIVLFFRPSMIRNTGHKTNCSIPVEYDDLTSRPSHTRVRRYPRDSQRQTKIYEGSTLR